MTAKSTPDLAKQDPDDQAVLHMIRQYARDHLGCSREEAVHYLTSCVSRAKSEIAVAHVAKEFPWLARGEVSA